MKIRYRYNGLFVLFCILFVFIFYQQKQIHTLKHDYSNFSKQVPTRNEISKRAKYINNRMDELEYTLVDMRSGVESNNDYLYNIINGKSKDMWIVGLTTDQIDSIIKGIKEKPYF